MTLKTRFMRVNPEAPEEDTIRKAARVLRRGGLVAFPTETVYGLGADALNAEAVQAIFVAKGRPLDNPIIVHVAGVEELKLTTDDITTEQEALADKFWPGPLTMIFKKSARLPAAVTAGRNTVAVRMPRNEVALALIKAAGNPVAAPSANLSGRPSPTAAEHVFEDLNGRIQLILDGGPVEVGLESTVLDTSRRPPVILRPGAITREELEILIGPVAMGGKGQLLARSPGTRHRHYSPRARVILAAENDVSAISHLVEQHRQGGRKMGVILHNPMPIEDEPMVRVRILPNELDQLARQLFAAMRELDQMDVEVMIIEKTREEGIGAAVMDRLTRAASS